MASENPKQEDKSFEYSLSPGCNAELASFHPRTGAVNDEGTPGDMAYPVSRYSTRDFQLSVGNVNVVDQSNDFAPTGAHVAAGLQMFRSGEEPNDNVSFMLWLRRNQEINSGITPVSGHGQPTGELGTNSLRPCRTGDDNNICSPIARGNQVIYPADTAPLLGHGQTNRELGTNSLQLHGAGGEASGSNIWRPSASYQFFHPGAPILVNSMDNWESGMNDNPRGAAQTSNNPEPLDGSFLSLGVGGDVRARYESNFSSEDGHLRSNSVVLPMVNAPYGPDIARSPLSSSSNTASGFSYFQKYPDWFERRLTNESLRQIPNLAGFPDLGQNAGFVPHHARDVVMMQNPGGFPSQIQSAGNHGLSQAPIFVNPAQNLSGLASFTDQSISAVNLPAQSSRVSCRPSWRRPATTSPSRAPRFLRARSRAVRPSSHVSTPAPLVPRVPQTAFNRSLLPQISRRPPFWSRNILPQHNNPLGMGKKLPVPSGNKCYICNRDLSFPPEGPIEQAEKPYPAAVLVCGHIFHDLCLTRMTPEDQAHDPPCVACAMGDKR